jgi:hypothetical protein
MFAAAAAEKSAGHLLFGRMDVPIFQIELSETGRETLSDSKSTRTYVRAAFTHDAQVLQNIGIRLKGRRTFQPLERKPSFSLKFNEFTNQTFLGLTKIILNNSTADPSYLREYLANPLFHQAGIPAPRVAHARVKLNGRDLGLYVVMEGITKAFLARYFRRNNGNLYEGAFQDIDGNVEQDNGADQSRKDLEGIVRATREPDPARRWKELCKVLDVEGFISFIAMEQLTGQEDGYTTQANNYRIYHDPDSDRMIFFPHGLDSAFAATNFAAMPIGGRLVVKAALRTHEGRRAYQEKLSELLAGVYDINTITSRVAETAARLAQAATTMNESASISSNCIALCKTIADRRNHIATALAEPDLMLLRFDSNGIAPITNWNAVGGSGTKMITNVINGRTTLSIHSAERFTTASFRAKVLLDPGQYSFQGELRVAGIEMLKSAQSKLLSRRSQNGGVRLYAVPGVSTNFVTEDLQWKRYEHDFEVQYGPQELELLCELNRSKGHVWFDRSSLRLIRK